LALLIVAFVERLYFVLRHGLTTVYLAGKQRFYAMICYRGIQLTMILNAMILTAWIVGFPVPDWLETWNHWSIAFHFGLALVGVRAVRDSDSVVANPILELKAAEILFRFLHQLVVNAERRKPGYLEMVSRYDSAFLLRRTLNADHGAGRMPRAQANAMYLISKKEELLIPTGVYRR
jgi:hypothetical protein